jgi:RHS repeat-associated protein
LTSAKPSASQPTTYTYDAGGRLATRTNGLSVAEISNTYDSSGRVVEQFDARNNKTTFAYSSDHTDVTDPRNGIWTDVHGGNVVTASYDPLGGRSVIGRDDNFNPTSLVQPDNTTLVSTFDSAGRVLKAARPSTETGTPNTFGYDSAGNVASYMQPSGGGATTFGYNAAKQLTSVKNAAGDTTSFAYGTGGTLTSATTPSGRATTFSYDAGGHPTQMLTPGGGRTTMAYDPAGHVTEQRQYREPADLATGHTVTASSTYTGFPAGNALDGNPTTRWSSAFSDPQWLQVDLGAAKTIDRVRLFWEAAYATAYQIQTSTDGTTWANAYTTTAGKGGEEVVSFTAVSARYVRMYGTKRATTAGYSLWDFNVYDTASRDFDADSHRYDAAGRLVEERQRGRGGSTDPRPGKYQDFTFTTYRYDGDGRLAEKRQARQIPADLAATATITASSSYTGFPVAGVNDGEPGTRWSSAFADPQWLQADLGSAKTVDRVRLEWEAAYATAYQIQTSTDGTTWTTQFSTTAGHGGEEIATFAPVSARYVRMSGTKRALTAGYSLWDFEVSNTTGVSWDSTLYGYDNAGNLTSVTDPAQHVTSYAYDPGGNLTSTTDAEGGRTSYTYDAANRRHTEVSPRGNADGANPAAFTTSYEYYPTGELKTETGPTGAVTSYTYDALGHTLSVTDPLNHVTNYTYDKNGNQKTVTDARNHTTTLVYDSANRLKTSTDPLNHATDYGYDVDGNLTSVTRPYGDKTGYLYNLDGRRIGVVDPRGYLSGNKATDYTAYTDYDYAGRVVQQTDPLGNRTAAGFDPAGRQITGADASGGTTRLAYDPLSRLISVTAPDGGVTGYTYDAAGNPARRTDDNHHTTGFTYDKADRLTSVTDALDNTVSYAYDADGNRTTVVNGRKTTTSTAYDARGLATSVDYGDNTPDVGYTYDAAGRTRTVTDGTGTTTLDYDENDKPTAVTLPAASAPSFVYAYDEAGRMKSRQLPDGRATSYTYDLDDRVSGQTTGGVITSFGYDYAGHLTTTTLPATNGFTEARTYDTAGRLTGIGTRNTAGAVLDADAVVLDRSGRPAKVTASRAGAPDQVRTFGYDSAGRLTTECLTPTTEQDCTGGTLTTYGYDKVGNRLGKVVRGGTTTTNTYDAADELTAAAVTGGATTAYTYDADGNQTAAGSDRFGYDAENRVVTAPGGLAYGYDADGNRRTTSQNGSVVRSSTWDSNNPLPELATDADASGAVTSYLSNPVGEPLSQRAGGADYYLTHDWLGSITAVTDASGVQQRRTTYDAYGVAATTALTTTAPADRFGFTGAVNDPDLAGRLLFPARSYTAATGAFTTRDPQRYPPTKPASSTYGYAEDGPTYLTDPSGRCAIICTAIIGGVIGGGIYAWQHRHDDNFSWTGLAKATGEGALIGAGAGFLMPAVGAGVVGYFGLEGGAAAATSMAVNASVGAGYTYAVNTALCRPTTPTDLFLGAIGGSLSVLGGTRAATSGPRVGAGGGWQTVDETAGGAEAQLTPHSCGSACGSMLAGSKVTQQQLLEALGDGANGQAIARKLEELTGENWVGGYIGGNGIDALSRVGSWGAELYEGGAEHHMVVVERLLANGNMLIRDPWAGGSTYQMVRAEFERVWTGNGFLRVS